MPYSRWLKHLDIDEVGGSGSVPAMVGQAGDASSKERDVFLVVCGAWLTYYTCHYTCSFSKTGTKLIEMTILKDIDWLIMLGFDNISARLIWAFKLLHACWHFIIHSTVWAVPLNALNKMVQGNHLIGEAMNLLLCTIGCHIYECLDLFSISLYSSVAHHEDQNLPLSDRICVCGRVHLHLVDIDNLWLVG